MDVITAFVNETPEPTSDSIVRVPPNVYNVLKLLVPLHVIEHTGIEMMEGIDVFAYSSMVTYINAMYLDFPPNSYDYCKGLLDNYLSALTSISKAVMYLLVRSSIIDRPVLDKFRRIVYHNWNNVNKLFKTIVLPVVMDSTKTDVIDLDYVEETFRARYPSQ